MQHPSHQRTYRLAAAIGLTFAVLLAPAGAQQLLDTVVARVGAAAITRTDVEAAVGLGIIAERPGASAVQQMIDRRLQLAEVSRFPPSEPAAEAIDRLVAMMKTHAGAGYEALLRRTGHDEQRVRDLARDTLRIEAYIEQRFGAAQTAERRRQVIDQWLQDLRMRGEVVVSSRP